MNRVPVVPEVGVTACFDSLVPAVADLTAGPTASTANRPITSAARQTETTRPSCFIGPGASVISPLPSSSADGPRIWMRPPTAAGPIVP